MDDRQSNFGLFDPRTEKLSVALTVSAAFLVVAEITLGYRVLLRPYEYLISLIVGIIFLEALHVTLTYLGLLFIPELKHWISLRTDNHPWRFWRPVCLRILVLFLIFFFFSNLFPYNSKAGPIVEWVGFVSIIMTLLHRILQTRGISSAYSHVHRLGLKKLARDTRIEQIEKLGFLCLFVSTALLFTSSLGFRFFTSVVTDGDTIKFIRTGSLVGAILSAMALVLLANFETGSGHWSLARKAKVHQQCRSFFYPLASFSIISSVATEALHGIEYILLWKKIAKSFKIQLPSRKLKVALILSVLIVVFYYIVTYSWGLWSMLRVYPRGDIGAETQITLRVAFALFMSITLTHFYLDKLLFSMKDDLNRRVIGPMLLGPP